MYRMHVLLACRYLSVSTHVTDQLPSPSVGLCVCLYVCLSLSLYKKYCGKMAEWFPMPFGMLSGISRGMGVLDGDVDRRWEGQFWGEFWRPSGDFVP